MSLYFHAVFHNNRHQLCITKKATQLALDKKKNPKDCNDMLPVLEWVFFPVNQPSLGAGGVSGGAKLALRQQLGISVL